MKRGLHPIAKLLFSSVILSSCTHSENHDYTKKLTPQESEQVVSEYGKCWFVSGKYKSNITLNVQLNADATVKSIQLLKPDAKSYATDSIIKEAVDSAKKAIERCSPNKYLPPEKFDSWKDLEITFDPRSMTPQ